MTVATILIIFCVVNLLSFLALFILERVRLGYWIDKKNAFGIFLFSMMGFGLFLFLMMLGIYLTRRKQNV